MWLTCWIRFAPCATDRYRRVRPAIRTAPDRSQRVFLCADKRVSYGDLTQVMNLLRAAGYLKVALVAAETD